jgi:Protein of unknown function (DUF3717)
MLVAELEALINSVRSIHPATGSEVALSREVALLAGIYGRLIYLQLSDTQQLTLTQAEQDALLK